MGNGGGNGGGVGGAGVPAGAQGDLFGGWDVTGQTEGNTGMTSAAFADAAFAGDITGAGMGPTGGGSAGPGASFGGGGDVAEAPGFGTSPESPGMTGAQKALLGLTVSSLLTGNLPGFGIGLAGLAFTSRGGTAPQVGEGGGPGVDQAGGQMQAHRDFSGQTGMTAPAAAKYSDMGIKAAKPERARRATTKTLFTSPLGIPGEPPVKRKTLMAKNLREDLG